MSNKSNKFEKRQQVQRVTEAIDVSPQLAKELLILAGGDEELVITASQSSHGLGQCRATIINARLSEEY